MVDFFKWFQDHSGEQRIVDIDTHHTNVWYRYTDGGIYDNGEVHVYCHYLPIISETDRTVLIKDWDKDHRVLKNSAKRYAYPDKASALYSYKRRKLWQIKHAERSIRDANAYLKVIDAEQQRE